MNYFYRIVFFSFVSRASLRLGTLDVKLKEQRMVVTVTLNLKPEVEAGLVAQAQAAGLPLEQFLSRYLENLTQMVSPISAHPIAARGAEEWENGLDAWLDSFPQHPTLSEEALKRENWYPDRW